MAGKLWVVACPRCRKAKVCAAGQKTTTCGHCSRALDLKVLTKHLETEDATQASNAAGMLNAKLSGQLDAFLDANVVPAAPPARKGSKAEQAHAVALDLAARGAFSAADLERAFAAAGLAPDDAGPTLQRLVASGALFEPRRGRFAAP
jgi:hypothetical protein